MAVNNEEAENANVINHKEGMEELEKVMGVQEVRIQNLQSSAFQLANYYFVFQGVVLAAISNTTSLTCSDAWFVFTLSFLAATLNLFALFSIGSKYVRAMDMHELTWSEFNAMSKSPAHNHDHDRALRTKLRFDHFAQRRRYVVLGVCMFLFIAFTAVTLSGTWRIICNHDKHRKHNHSNGDCLKLCDGSRCIFFCQY